MRRAGRPSAAAATRCDRGMTPGRPAPRRRWCSTSARCPAKGYASHGESWSFALALRLASFDLLRADGDDPILILDDVFAELDADRRERLAEMVADAEQVLVTAAVADDVPAELAGARVEVDGTRRRRGRRTTARRPRATRTRRRPAGSEDRPHERPARPGPQHRPSIAGRGPPHASGPPRADAGPSRAPTGARPDDRDPQTLDQTLGRLIAEQGWSRTCGCTRCSPAGQLIVGREVASTHAGVAAAEEDRGCTSWSQADSTAWATQMRLLAATIVAKPQRGARRRHRDPDRRPRPVAPSWKKGRARCATAGDRATPTADGAPARPCAARLVALA